MNEPAKRRQFTLLQLLVFVAVLCGVLAVGAMFVSKAITEMRKTRCSSHLRQWGIAAHRSPSLSSKISTPLRASKRPGVDSA